MKRGMKLLTLLVLAGNLMTGPAPAQERFRSAEQGAAIGVWTGIIPDAFPVNVYTWRLKTDGTYAEDGEHFSRKFRVQPTLSGRWTVGGAHMTMTQDTVGYVFEGTVRGDHYYATLYLNKRAVSRFCAFKGTVAPHGCDGDFLVFNSHSKAKLSAF